MRGPISWRPARRSPSCAHFCLAGDQRDGGCARFARAHAARWSLGSMAGLHPKVMQISRHAAAARPSRSRVFCGTSSRPPRLERMTASGARGKTLPALGRRAAGLQDLRRQPPVVLPIRSCIKGPGPAGSDPRPCAPTFSTSTCPTTASRWSPPRPRDAARLLVVRPARKRCANLPPRGEGLGVGGRRQTRRCRFDDRLVRDLPDLLRPGDALVFNDTRVIRGGAAGRAPARREPGADRLQPAQARRR